MIKNTIKNGKIFLPKIKAQSKTIFWRLEITRAYNFYGGW